MLPGCKEAVRLHQRQLQALGLIGFTALRSTSHAQSYYVLARRHVPNGKLQKTGSPTQRNPRCMEMCLRPHYSDLPAFQL